MKSLIRSRASLNMITRGAALQRSQFMLVAPTRNFSLPRYHFDDKDYEPTIEEVS